MIEEKRKEKIFIGDIRKCTGVKRTTFGRIEGFGTIDTFGSMEINSEIYKKNVYLLEVADNKYVDFSYFTCFENLRNVVEAVSNNKSLENIILGDFETCEGKLFVDSDSLRSFADIKQDFVDGNERINIVTYNKKITKNSGNKKLVKAIKKNKLR